MKNSLLVALVLLISACAPIQVVTSENVEKEQVSGYRYYDSNSKIRYQVSNNQEYLFLSLNTVNKASIMKIVQTGLSIYIDTNGKKNTERYIQYPLKKRGGLDQNQPGRDQGLNQGGRPPKMNLGHMLSRLPREAFYVNEETRQSIDLKSENSGVKIEISEDQGGIIYSIQIPFSLVSPNEFSSLNNLVIGIESGEFEMPSRGPAQGGEATQGGARENMAGNAGGRPGGGQGGRPQGPPSGQQTSEMTEPIEFWFQVDLFRGVNQ